MKFLISEEEKSRILNMHKNAIKRQYLMEQEPIAGNVYNAGREESLVKQGMYYIGFQIVGNNTPYYYQCIWDPNSFYDVTKIKGTAQEPGAVMDGDGNVIKNPQATLGLTGNYKEEFKNGCATSYSQLQKFRDTHCPNQKDKVWKSPEHYKQQCEGWNTSKQNDAKQAAAAEAEAATAATQDANSAAMAKSNLEGDKVMSANAMAFATPFNKLYNELGDLVNGTSESNYAMGTQQDIEAKINQLQSYWSDPNAKGKSTARYADENIPYSIGKALRFIPKLIQTAKTKYPNMTATFVK
jgi:hypothetical protein